MILIGLGANLPSAAGSPLATCLAALRVLAEGGVTIERVSPWYRSEPQPPSGQPWFVNGVALVSADMDALGLLKQLHAVENQFGRVRSERNAARSLDLDLLAFGDQVHAGEVNVPHPRLHERAFVLAPLADLAPGWRHPTLGKTAGELLAGLPPGQGLDRLSPHEP